MLRDSEPIWSVAVAAKAKLPLVFTKTRSSRTGFCFYLHGEAFGDRGLEACTLRFIPRAHRIGTLSFGPGVGSDLRADREPSLGFDTAGPEAQPYRSINSRKAKGRWY